MDFFLGTPEPSWLRLTDVPLFVSAARLRRRSRSREARHQRKRTAIIPGRRWGLDSAGFTQLSIHGRWDGTDADYAREATEWADEEGSPEIASPRDWMCEPRVLAQTGGTIADHQARTIESYVNLCAVAPNIAWMPVLQGWQPDDYRSHFEQYRTAGIDLCAVARVGVGSVCRRQGTKDGARIMHAVADLGVRIHAFGIKVDGLRLFGNRIASSDSMTWSYIARRRRVRLDGCAHQTCNYCLRWALEWHRTRLPIDEATGQPGVVTRQTAFSFAAR